MPETIVANAPTVVQSDALKAQNEAMVKAELLKDLSLDDIRMMISAIKSGAMTNQNDAPDTFDEYGRNFRRMVHKLEVAHNNGGGSYWIERPMAKTLAEALKDSSDWFDIDAKTWVLYGKKRQLDYPENTVGYMESKGI